MGSAFHLFVDEPMLCFIQKFTIKHVQVDNENFPVELCELEKFIGLQLVLVVLVGTIALIDQLWGKEWDHPIFISSIIRDRYKGVDEAFEV